MDILYEDNHLIAVNKSTNDLVQGDKTGDRSLDTRLKEYLKTKYNKPGNVFVGVTHRLDRPVSGVVLFARTSKALTRMNALFNEGKVKKTYWAIVKDAPPKADDELTHYLVRNETVSWFVMQKKLFWPIVLLAHPTIISCWKLI